MLENSTNKHTHTNTFFKQTQIVTPPIKSRNKIESSGLNTTKLSDSLSSPHMSKDYNLLVHLVKNLNLYTNIKCIKKHLKIQTFNNFKMQLIKKKKRVGN